MMRVIETDELRMAAEARWRRDLQEAIGLLKRVRMSAMEESGRYWREYRADMDPADWYAAEAMRGLGALAQAAHKAEYVWPS